MLQFHGAARQFRRDVWDIPADLLDLLFSLVLSMSRMMSWAVNMAECNR
ncbi:MAG: hypothetical protein J4F48_01165 [Nitrospinae bacterium]|nr:hypothetical protein [Nitrospinota bacterium]